MSKSTGLHSEWAKALGLRTPVVCAPMGGVAGGALAGAVSRAGALGMIGMGSAASPELLSRELALVDAGGAPFGVGFVGWGLERMPEMLDIALAAEPAVVSVSFLDWESSEQLSWIQTVQRAGALAVTQVATVAEAKLAEQAGMDAIVARGSESGGHGDHQAQRGHLLTGVLTAVGLPVLSAGAIHDDIGVAAALREGASAAWIGTAFSACPEALTSDDARQVLLAAEGSETIVSRVLDVALGRPWPQRFPERLLRTGFVDRWQGREEELAADEVARAEFRAAYAAGDFGVVPIDAGEGVGALTRVQSAADVVAALTPGV